MASLDSLAPKLMRMSPRDLNLVESLVDHIMGLGTIDSETGRPPDDAELWWAELTGDNAWRSKAAEPLWAELAELQKEPSKNFRTMAEIKKRLRAIGQI
jgi:hypothetical protein